jgi:hypothetical protein
MRIVYILNPYYLFLQLSAAGVNACRSEGSCIGKNGRTMIDEDPSGSPPAGSEKAVTG